MKKITPKKSEKPQQTIHVLCLFPQVFDAYLSQSLMARAQKNKILKVDVIDLRCFASDRRRTVDDAPYGGGPGMLLKPGPIVSALKKLGAGYRVLLTPHGQTFNQAKALNLSTKKHLILICGHYEGVDQRIADHYVDEEISVGDFILSGGEIAALILLDAVSRVLPGFIGNKESLLTETFNDKILDYPQYTRPEIFEGRRVPKILLEGDHDKIKKWRWQKSLEMTREKRPDLLG